MAPSSTTKPLDCSAVRERLRQHLQDAPAGLGPDRLAQFVTSVELLEEARACGLLPNGRNRFFMGLMVALALSALLWGGIILIAAALGTA